MLAAVGKAAASSSIGRRRKLRLLRSSGRPSRRCRYVTSRVRASVDIDAPVDEVFEFFDDIGNASVLVPNLIDVQKVEPLTSGGRRIEYTTRGRNGEVIDASSEHAEHEPPRRTVTKGVQSGVSTTSTREFDTIAYGVTRVSATVEWSVPVRYVAKIVEYPLRGPFRRSLRDMLLAAKDTIEGRIST